MAKYGTAYLTRIGDQLLQCLHSLIYFISPFLKQLKIILKLNTLHNPPPFLGESRL